MSDRLVPIRSFGNRMEAEMAHEQLEEEGIPSYVSGDDAGGMRPPLQLTQGVNLIVREADVERAEAILGEGES